MALSWDDEPAAAPTPATAAPEGVDAALVAKRVNADLLLTLVGVVVTITSVYGLYRAL